jgi:hypothetical protein
VVDEIASRSGVSKCFVAMRNNNNTVHVDFAFAWLKSRKGLELRSGAPADHRSDDRALVSLSHSLANGSLLVKPKTCAGIHYMYLSHGRLAGHTC